MFDRLVNSKLIAHLLAAAALIVLFAGIASMIRAEQQKHIRQNHKLVQNLPDQMPVSTFGIADVFK